MGVDTVSSVQDVCGVQWTIDLWAVCNATQRRRDENIRRSLARSRTLSRNIYWLQTRI